LILVWAVSWPIIKVGVATVPPIWFGFLRYAIGILCMTALVVAARERLIPPRADLPLILVSGALQMAAFSAFMGIALVTLPPGRASVLAYATPLWVVPLAALWLGERVTLRAGIGVMLGLAGVASIAAPAIATAERTQILAYLSLMAAAAAWAATIVYIRSHRFTASPFALAPSQMLVAALLLLAVAPVVEGPFPEITASGAAALAFVGPVSTAFAYWAVVEVGRRFRAGTVSMALLATPSLGITISALTLDEEIGPSLVAGVILTGFGIWLATTGNAERPTSQSS
jgi:drug/metabolite transporter (DMT)-like permease